MVLAFIQHDDGEVDDVSVQTLTLARDVTAQVGEPLDVIAFGPEAAAVADDAGAYGAETVHAVEHRELGDYAPEAYARAIVQCAEETGVDAIVAPGSDRGSETLAHAAAKLDEPMAAEVVDVDAGEEYELTRQRWGGTLLEHARLAVDTKVLTVAPNEVSPAPVESGPADVEPFTPELEADDLRVQLTRIEESDVEGVPLGEARVVVSGGRGTDGDFSALEELVAQLPDAAIGASRAAVNEEWRPHDDQVGQTGTKIAPEIYIACGISGAVQHMVGCKGAEHILAVNTDPEAAIVQKSDWVVVADLHEVVPAITTELDRRVA